MSDRVAVFESGGVAQIGTPGALYKEPATSFVANFIGENNTLSGKIEAMSGAACVVDIGADARIAAMPIGALAVGDAVNVTIRPECIRLAAPETGTDMRLEGTVEGRIYLGDHQRLLLRLGNAQELTVKIGAEAPVTAGEKLMLAWSTADCRAFPTKSATNP
jgi:putative spermidine/putrescine transport system ATP-binding protein